jgi:pilus assembly protein FimV
MPDSTVPMRAAAAAATTALPDINFQLDAPTVKQAPKNDVDAGLDFDLGDLSTDDSRTDTSPAPPPNSKFGDFSIGTESIPSAAAPLMDADPLARKLELAEEFRQIGDLEGARDLLEEVVSKADGALRNKAQSMLDRLG